MGMEQAGSRPAADQLRDLLLDDYDDTTADLIRNVVVGRIALAKGVHNFEIITALLDNAAFHLAQDQFSEDEIAECVGAYMRLSVAASRKHQAKNRPTH